MGIFLKRFFNTGGPRQDPAPAAGLRGDEEAGTADDVVDWLDLPRDFKAPDADAAHYRSPNTFDLGSLEDAAADEAKWAAFVARD
jgi:hypothetical protein